MGQRVRIPNPVRHEWLIFAVAVFVLGAVLGYLGYHDYSHIRERETRRLVTQAELTQDMIALELDAIGTTLSNIRVDLTPGWETREDVQAVLRDRLKTLVAAMASLRTISILDATGKAVVSSHEGITGKDLHERDYFQIAKRDPDPNTLHVGQPFLTDLGTWALPLTRVIVGENNEFAGVITSSLDPKVFRIVLNSVRYAPDVWASLAHGDGLLFLMEPDRPEVTGMNLAVPGSSFTRHTNSGQKSSVGEGLVHATREYRLMALHSIQPPSLHMDKPFVVAMARDVTAIYASWKKDLIMHFVLYVILVVAGFAGLVVLQRHMRKAQRDAALAQEKLRKSQEELERFFQISPDLMCILDLEGHFINLNQSWETIFGYSLEKFKTSTCYLFLHPDDVATTTSAVAELKKNVVSKFCNRFSRMDGSYRYIEWHAAAHDGVVYASARDVTARREAEVRLHAMAYHDRLTGLPNRALFFDRFSQAISGARRGKHRVGLLFIDLDGFKMVNDQYGHDAGDAVLKTVSRRFSESVRATDTVARTGGDEFLIVLPDLKDPEEAAVVARKLLASISERIAVSDALECSVGASIGISIYPDHGEDMDSLLIAADSAMYHSKKGGKNGYSYYSESVVQKDDFQEVNIIGAEYLVGVKIIDDQHQKQADLVRQLNDAIDKKASKEYVDQLFTELFEFTRVHFATENSLMTHYKYPKISSHNIAHHYLLEQLSEFRAHMSKGGDQFMFISLEHWLLQHILTEDKPLGMFLQNKDVDDLLPVPSPLTM